MRQAGWVLLFWMSGQAVASFVPPPKVSFCAAMLQQLRQAHSAPNVSEINTQLAVTFLRRFRLEVLNHPEVLQPRVDEMQFHSGSVLRTQAGRKRLAEQIRGIELGARQETRIADDSEHFLWASVIRGSKAISEFYSALREDTQARSVRNASQTALTVAANFWTAQVAPLMVMLVAQSDPKFAVLPAAVLLSGVDRYYSGFGSRLWRWDGRLKASESAALSEDPGTWHFLSVQSRVYQDEILPFAQMNRGGAGGVGRSVLDPDLSFLERTLRDAVQHWVAKWSGSKPRRKLWIQSNLLAAFDPRTGEPVVVPVVRFSLYKPKFPRPRRRGFFEQLEERTREKKALPIPVSTR